MCIFAFLAGYPPAERLIIMIIGLSMLWKGPMTVLAASYQGHEAMQYTSIGAISETVFMSAVAVSALLMGAKAKEMAIISIISRVSSIFVCSCGS